MSKQCRLSYVVSYLEGVYMQNPSPHLWRHASDFSFPHKLSGAVDSLLSISVYMIKQDPGLIPSPHILCGLEIAYPGKWTEMGINFLKFLM